MKLHSWYACCFFCLLLTFPVMAKNSTGELKIKGWNNKEGTVSIPVMKLRYSLGSIFGEPTEKFIFYYESQDKFTEIFNIKLTAQVISGGITQDAYININPSIEPPGKWGWDIAGSADWDNMFVNAEGESISEKKAKSFYKNGISLTNLKINYINAKSGVNDDKYNAFASQLPTSYVRSKNSQRKLELQLPSLDFWNSDNNFWKDRVSAMSNWLHQENTVNGSEIVMPTTHSKATGWMYGQYQHMVIVKGFRHRTDKDKGQQIVEIDVIWKTLDYAVIRKRSFRQTLRKGQMVMVVGDRISRPLTKDGSLQRYNLSITVRYINEDKEEEEDPLKDLAETDLLDEALKQDQLVRTNEARAQLERGIENAHRINKDIQVAQKLAAEQKEKKRIAREKYLASDQYKIDQAIKKKERDALERNRQLALVKQQEALERNRQLALVKQQEAERLQELERLRKEEERNKYDEFYVVVFRQAGGTYHKVKKKSTGCKRGSCLKLGGGPSGYCGNWSQRGLSKTFTVKYSPNEEWELQCSSSGKKACRIRYLMDERPKTPPMASWISNNQLYYNSNKPCSEQRINVLYFKSKLDADNYRSDQGYMSEFNVPPPPEVLQ
jgi:hypothetical protein